MKSESTGWHRFSNRSEVREDILFLARHDRIPDGILRLALPVSVQFALAVELKSATKAVLA